MKPLAWSAERTKPFRGRAGQPSFAGTTAPLLLAFGWPQQTRSFDLSSWNSVIRQANNEGLTARLAASLEAAGVFEQIPEKAQVLLRDAVLASHRQDVEIRFEVGRILRALAGLEIPIVLLKGAAYLMAGLPPARGRFSSDIDILVPEPVLGGVEQAFLAAGWVSGKTDDYDQAYYRQWMHELPPLVHGERGTVVDLHHTILPRTSRVQPDAAALIAAAQPLKDPRLRVLAPPDMVIHACLHLFHDGAVAGGLRDLIDLDQLLRHFGTEAGFWPRLQARAELHGAGRPLYYLLRYAQALLGTPVPAEVAAGAAAWGPGPGPRKLMDAMIARVLVPQAPMPPGPADRLAAWLLYCRSHWIRMPPGLLGRHLAVKAARRLRKRPRDEP